jgi:hypothetical protein
MVMMMSKSFRSAEQDKRDGSVDKLPTKDLASDYKYEELLQVLVHA